MKKISEELSVHFPFQEKWVFTVNMAKESKKVDHTMWSLLSDFTKLEKKERHFKSSDSYILATKLGDLKKIPQTVRMQIVKPLLSYLEKGAPLETDFLDFIDFSKIESDFAKKVYRKLATSRNGQRFSYGAMAKTAGKSGAARAVGTLMRKNPWPLLVPCHRVIQSNGKLGNYSAPLGKELKSVLWSIENRGEFL